MPSALSNSAAIIATLVMSAITFALRGLPFWIFARNGRQIPPVVDYLGKVLPQATMVMLVVYCLRHVSVTLPASIFPTLIGVGVVVVLQVWKKNSIISVFLGTAAYMVSLSIFS